jgi:dephospho-CoA kinase
MKIVGLTGGIGSGKTTVSKIFETLHIPVFYADDEAKKLYHSEEVLNNISYLVEENIQDTEGRLNRKKLASILFTDPEKLKKVNAYIHPMVKNVFEDWISNFSSESMYVIREAAILIESGSYKDCDAIILVTAPEELRIERVMNRDGVNKEDVIERIRNQMSEEEKEKYADFIINNDGENPLIQQVLKIHHQLIHQ